MDTEIIKIPFDFKQLQRDVEYIYANYPPVMLTDTFGGWSIASSSGDYKDGWVKTEKYSNIKINSIDELILEDKKSGLDKDFIVPTELCTLNFYKILYWLSINNFYPRRARLMLLRAGGSSNYHQDFPDWMYGVRLHIPIFTNDKCFFRNERGKIHFEANGNAYLVKVNEMHQVINDGGSDRIHFICNFYDATGRTKNFKMSDEDLELVKKIRKAASN